jgi:competence protein ComEA
VDPTSTPWRALEDPSEKGSGIAEPAAPAGGIPRSAVVAGGGAVLLAVAAFFLAFDSNTNGSISVDATTPLPIGASQSGSGPGPGGSFDGGAGPVLVVEIIGAVDRPGVYRVPAGARVGDLVESAGGYGPRVDTDRAGHELNLAAPLHDGDQVRVPSRDDPVADPAEGGSVSGSTGAGPALIDLNRATAAELDSLPGIGPVTAAKIIASRDEHLFGTVDDLRTRKLVGEKTFASLKDLVAVR